MTMQKNVVIIKGIPGCAPSRICEINGLDDVVANSHNLPYLLSCLRNNGIEAAAVAGWNDHVSYDLVLRSNGALAPFDALTNYADHAFCIERGRGCNRKPCYEDSSVQKHWSKPCQPMPKPSPVMPQPLPQPSPIMPQPAPQPKPWPLPPQPYPPAPKPKPWPCPPQPKPCPPAPKPSCDSDSSSSSSSSSSSYCSSSSSSSSSCEEDSTKSSICKPVKPKQKKGGKCPKYVKQRRMIYKNKHPRKKCEDRVNLALENIKIVKTFIFNERDMCNRRMVKFREVTDRASNLIKWVELKPILDGKKMTKENYPALLRFPGFLYELRKYLVCKYKYPTPCLYLDCYGRLYVRIRDTLYLVKFRRNVRFSQRKAFKYIKLCPVRGKKLDCLIQQGLAGVVFEGCRY